MKTLSIYYRQRGVAVNDFEIDSYCDSLIREGGEYYISTLLVIDELRARVSEGKLQGIDLHIYFEYDNGEIREIEYTQDGQIKTDLKGCSIITRTAHVVGRLLCNQKTLRQLREPIIEELKGYLQLHNGWDGYEESNPPFEEVVHNIIKIVQDLPLYIPNPKPMLSDNGIVGIYWDLVSHVYLEVCCDEGTCWYYFEDSHVNVEIGDKWYGVFTYCLLPYDLREIFEEFFEKGE